MTIRTHYLAIALLAGFGLALGACGGSGSDSGTPMTETPDPEPAPMEYDVALPAGHGLNDGMTTIDAGETLMLASGTEITCPGPEACTVTVSTDDVTGAQSATSTGGTVVVTTEATRHTAAVADATQALANAQAGLIAAQAAADAAQMAYEAGTLTANDRDAAVAAVAVALAAVNMAQANLNVLVPPPEPEPPVQMAVDLMGSTDLMAGMTSLQPGESSTVGLTTISCAADGEACDITVMDDPVTGAQRAYSTGGVVTVAVAEPPAPPMEYNVALPDGHELSAGTTNLPMGDTVIGDTTISCPATDGCTLTVSMDSVTGAYVGVATGGVVTVAVADPPAPPMEYDVDLPDGHGLADGTTTIAAGKTVTVDGTEIACEGDEACTVTVSTDVVTGAQSATSTGGMVTVSTEDSRMAAAVTLAEQAYSDAKDDLADAQDALAAAQAAYDDGTGTGNAVTAAQEAVTEAQAAVTMAQADLHELVPPPGPVVAEATGTVTHAALAAFLEILEVNEATTFTVPANGTAVRGGITFACHSERDCEVTIENSAGTIVASWTSYSVDGSETMVAATHPSDDLLNDPLHPNLTLNVANAASVADIIEEAIESTGTPDGARGNASTTIGGMDLDGFGVDDMSMLTLTSDLDPNVTNHDTTGTPTGGATLHVSDDPATMDVTEGDVRTLHADRAALDGWDSSVLFADWGDSKSPGRDGGYETAALLYSDHEAPTTEAFDDDLAAKIANTAPRGWFTLNTDGAVAIPGNNEMQNARTEITVEGGQISTLSTTVPANSTHQGTYFGASGTFACGTTPCEITRDETGSTPFNIDGAQAWTFTPDDDQTVQVPDQDYMVFGAWLTVPDDNVNGEHRIGVFYDGMREYVATDVDRLIGTATYKGGAAGVYRDANDASGMFTANATLTADFADAAPGTLEGRIDNFRNSNGVYLGTDTAANPNDPTQGGENDWVVTLSSSAIVDGGVAADSTIAGSADGVTWAGGQWGARFYGASGTADAPTAPTGVAGQFRAQSAMRGVVGSFGAMHVPAADD